MLLVFVIVLSFVVPLFFQKGYSMIPCISALLLALTAVTFFLVRKSIDPISVALYLVACSIVHFVFFYSVVKKKIAIDMLFSAVLSDIPVLILLMVLSFNPEPRLPADALIIYSCIWIFLIIGVLLLLSGGVLQLLRRST